MINERLSKYEHLDGPDELQARLLGEIFYLFISVSLFIYLLLFEKNIISLSFSLFFTHLLGYSRTHTDHTDDQAQTKAVIDELEKQKTNISQEKFQLQEQCRSFKTQLEENKIDIETLRQTMSDKDQSTASS